RFALKTASEEERGPETADCVGGYRRGNVPFATIVNVATNQSDFELLAYQHLDQLENVVAFRAWLAQIGKRVCWQLKEKEALRPILQLSMLEDEGGEIAGDDPT